MDYGRRQQEDGLRITVENTDFYSRGRSPSPRNQFRHGGGRRRSFSPDREKQSYYRDRDEPRNRGWMRSQDERSPPRRSPERYSTSWRRNSVDRSSSPPRGKGLSKGRNFFNRSRSRSRSRRRSRKSRSRSSSRGRARYRDSRSPRRRSPRNSSARSSSYGYRKKMKRSSPSSGSSSDDDRRSSSGDSRGKNKDDIFKAMYSNKDEKDSDSENGGYLHPVLDRGPKDQRSEPIRPAVNMQPVQMTGNSHSDTNAASLAALSQAYGNSPSKKPYTQQEIDDEDRFLYGDDAPRVEEKPKFANTLTPQPPAPVQPPPQPVAVQETASQNVTPGGFDSNALKNVLKAIGFDFEMSAQQSQTGNKPAVLPKTKETAPTPQAPVRQAPQVVETPQQIQTIQRGQVNRPAQPAPPPPQPVQVQQPIQQYFNPYDPYNQNTSASYPPQPDPTQAQNMNAAGLGYPIQVPDPANPGGSLLVYQPVSAAGQPQQIYQQQQHPATLIQHQPVNVHPPQESGRVVLPPHRPDMPEPKKSDKEMRKERLSYLQVELEKLKKQQNELLRKKRREKDGHKDPLLKKNTMLQAGVEEQIREIRMAAEKAADIDATMDSSGGEDEEKMDKEDKYDYFDPGKHWCKLCNTISEDLGEFLSHLHSKSHRKAVDPYDRPWNDNKPDKKKKSAECMSKSLKGSEFLIPITGYFCTLCQTFSGDQMCAEDHCKSYLHNNHYKKHCKKNSSYEKKFKKKKKAAMSLMENGSKEIKQEPVEKEVKYVEKPPKHSKEDSKKKHKHAEKESVWIEKPVKYPNNDMIFEEKNQHAEKKKDKKRRSIEEEMPQDRYNQFVDRREVTRRSREKEIYRDEPKPEKLPRKYSDEYQQLPRSIDRAPPGRFIDHVQPSRSADHRQSSHSTDREQTSRSIDREQDDHGKPSRSSDHGRRRQNRWSPGYDEYERQQDDRFDKKHDRRSHSRDREKWVERPPREDVNKKSAPDKKDGQSISAGGKIPTPGFGKFSWNSNSKNESSVVFDQVQADTPVSTRAMNESKNGDFAGKSKIAIKITGKTQIYPPRMSAVSSKNSTFGSDKAAQDKRASMASELQRKVEALKRENALRAQLSSVTLPAGRNAKQFQPKPNTAAVILGTRSIGKHNTLQYAKNKEPLRTKPQLPKAISTKLTTNVVTNPPLPKEDNLFHIEADVSPTGSNFPPLPEPPPPGEEEITMGDGDDGANSDASGISMEIASDEE